MAQTTGPQRRMLDMRDADRMSTLLHELEPKPVTKLSIAQFVEREIDSITAAQEKGITLHDIFEALSLTSDKFEVSFETFRRYVNAARKPATKPSGKSKPRPRHVTQQAAKETAEPARDKAVGTNAGTPSGAAESGRRGDPRGTVWRHPCAAAGKRRRRTRGGASASRHGPEDTAGRADGSPPRREAGGVPWTKVRGSRDRKSGG